MRTLIVLNGLSGAAIVTLLLAMPTRQWIMSAFDLFPSPEADRLIMGLRAIALVGLAAILLHYAVLKRLLAIVETVRTGNPFVAANASCLRAIAWALFALQLLSLVVGAIAKAVLTPENPLHRQSGFSVNGWLAERRSGHVIIMVSSLLASGLPVVHMANKGGAGGGIA